MKLRIFENALRLRLSQSEVALLVDQGILRSRIHFAAGSRLEYVLESSPASVAPTAQFADGVLRVVLPEASVLEWARSEQVSIASEQAVGKGGPLKLLVEKDFQCLTPRENETDMFPHPEAGKRSC